MTDTDYDTQHIKELYSAGLYQKSVVEVGLNILEYIEEVCKENEVDFWDVEDFFQQIDYDKGSEKTEDFKNKQE